MMANILKEPHFRHNNIQGQTTRIT